MTGSDSEPSFVSFTATDMIMTDEQKLAFIRDGFVVLRGAVSKDLVERAEACADQSIEEGTSMCKQATKASADAPVRFGGAVQHSDEITDLFFKSGLEKYAEHLLGEGNVVLRGRAGQVAYVKKQELLLEAGMTLTERRDKNKWHIDPGKGKYAALRSDFSFIIGVALSSGQDVDENRGQFHVWPGSHLKTHLAMREAVRNNPVEEVFDSFRKNKPDVGLPIRLLLKPGDVVVGHQRLAHAAGNNLCDIVRKNVYLRIHHVNLDNFLEEQLHSKTPWVGYEGLSHLLPEGATGSTEGGLGKNNGVKQTFLSAKPCGDSLPAHVREKVNLSSDQKKEFIKNGYLILPEFVGKNKVRAALEHIDNAYSNKEYHMVPKTVIGSDKETPVFAKSVQNHRVVMDLVCKTGLVDVSEQILGEQNVIVFGNCAQIDLMPTSEKFVEEGRAMDARHPKRHWNIGRTACRSRVGGSGYSLVLTIALTEGQEVDENRGQLVVVPGKLLMQLRNSPLAIETQPIDLVSMVITLFSFDLTSNLTS